MTTDFELAARESEIEELIAECAALRSGIKSAAEEVIAELKYEATKVPNRAHRRGINAKIRKIKSALASAMRYVDAHEAREKKKWTGATLDANAVLSRIFA